MLGAITGDVVGSVYEWANIKHKNFEPLFSPRAFFTDDTVLTVALMDGILNDKSYDDMLKQYYQEYPHAGYGHLFHEWCKFGDRQGYNSWGNGAAMRTSAVGFAYNTLDEVLEKAEKYSSYTHNHPEGIKGAQATSSTIFLARNGSSKADIKAYISEEFGYDLDRTLDEIRPSYLFNESCQETVPEAIIAFLESTDFEDSIRNAISLGGDSDTLTCITGGIAEAFYGDIPQDIANESMSRLTPDLRDVVYQFYQTHRPSKTVDKAYEFSIKQIEQLNMRNTSKQAYQESKGDFQKNQDAFWQATIEHSNKKGLLGSLLSKMKSR
jgi:ADP-ribosylglycohydrolase